MINYIFNKTNLISIVGLKKSTINYIKFSNTIKPSYHIKLFSTGKYFSNTSNIFEKSNNSNSSSSSDSSGSSGLYNSPDNTTNTTNTTDTSYIKNIEKHIKFYKDNGIIMLNKNIVDSLDEIKILLSRSIPYNCIYVKKNREHVIRNIYGNIGGIFGLTFLNYYTYENLSCILCFLFNTNGISLGSIIFNFIVNTLINGIGGYAYGYYIGNFLEKKLIRYENKPLTILDCIKFDLHKN